MCIKSAKLIEGHSLNQGNKEIFYVFFEIRNGKASQLMSTMTPYFALVLDIMTPYFALVINPKF